MRIKGRSRVSVSAGVLAAALLGFASPALAQETSTADPAAATAEDDGGLGEIIVTAQRRAQNIQDVSIAIQAITAEGLAKSGINDVSRLELISPGVTYARYGSDSKISMRGANSNNTFLDSSPSVGAFVDGVYRPRASQQTRSFFDVERLEILKGPQGTLYGRNTLAGAINLYTVAPDVDDFRAGATVSYARFNTARAEGYVNIPVGDSFALRFAGMYERGDGWVENLAGKDLGAPDTISFRASARYEFDGGGDVTLRVTNVRERGTNTGLFAQTGTCRNVTAQGLTDPFGALLDCRNPRRGSLGTRRFDQLKRLQVLKDFVHEDKIDEFNATLEFNTPLFSDTSLKGIFSFTDFDLDLGQDSDFSEVQVSADFLRERVKSYTAEIQLSNSNENRFQYTIGGYASEDKIDFLSGAIRFARDINNLTTRPPQPLAPFAGPCVQADVTALRCIQRLDPTPLASTVIDLGNPLTVNAAGQPTREGQSSNNFQYNDQTSLGLFGQVSFEIVEDLRLVGGIRYSRDKKDAVNYGGGTAGSTLQGPQFPLTIPRTIDGFAMSRAIALSRLDRTYENFTYRAAIEYDVNEDVLLFANYSTGFLSGSLAANATSTDDQKSENFELGIKSRFLDRRLQVNASVYHTKYTNLITSFQRPNNSGGVDTLSINGGDIESTGFEAVIEARPVNNLRLTIGLSYLDAKFGTFAVLAPHQLVNGNPAASGRFVNLSGVRPQFAPEFQGSFVGAYDIELASGAKITPQIQFYYSDDYSSQTQLSFIDPAGTQKSFTKTDLRLAFTSADERYGIEAFVENLENKIVKQRTTFGGDGIEQITYGYPRNYGVKARFKF